MRRLLALMIALALTGCAADDASDPIPAEPDAIIDADLTITVEHPDAVTVEYRVTCADGTATVVGLDLPAEAACARLSIPEVQDRLTGPVPDDRVCTEIFGGPDTAHIRGTLDGRAVDTVVDRSNGCGISDWDNVLADLLPPALGVTG